MTSENEKPIEQEEETDSDGWINIIGSGGLKKKIITAGITESRPQKGDVVQIDAVGRLEDGTVVEELKNFTYVVEGGELIDGLDLITKLMDKEEESEVFMEARFAYGPKGLDNRIPPNSNLYYTVKMIDFKPEENPEDIEIATRLETGIQKRERGNWWYNIEEYTKAVKCYNSSLDYLDDTTDTLGETISDDVKNLLQERMVTLNNMAAAQIKLEAYDMALRSLSTVLQCQPNNVKALYRKGKILGLQGKAQEGYQVLKKALCIAPDSIPTASEAAKLKKQAEEESESEKSLYRKMLGLSPPVQEPKEHDRYPTIRGFPFKIVATFLTLLFVGVLIAQYVFNYAQ